MYLPGVPGKPEVGPFVFLLFEAASTALLLICVRLVALPLKLNNAFRACTASSMIRAVKREFLALLCAC